MLIDIDTPATPRGEVWCFFWVQSFQ